MLKRLLCLLVFVCVICLGCHSGERGGLALETLGNPVLQRSYNLRDPSVYKTDEGYYIYYSRFDGRWDQHTSWSIGSSFTKDFKTFSDDRELTAKGYASPDAPVFWKGRYILSFCTYQTGPSRLCYIESSDLQTFSTQPKVFLEEVADLPWNKAKRGIDPTLVVNGDTLYCFFVGSDYRISKEGKKYAGNLIGCARTTDAELKEWTIQTVDKPLVGPTSDAKDGCENLTVFHNGKKWIMIYSKALKQQRIAWASSDDLEHWDLHGEIDIPVQSWMNSSYGAPFVWKEGDNCWYMILMGNPKEGTSSLGLLRSNDGMNWTIFPEQANMN